MCLEDLKYIYIEFVMFKSNYMIVGMGMKFEGIMVKGDKSSLYYIYF